MTLSIFFSIFTVINYFNTSKISEKLKIGDNIKYAYFGDSHFQKLIDDNIIENSVNLGETSELFYFTYYKIKTFLKENKQIEKVFLAVGYNSFSSYSDEFYFGKYSIEISPKYFVILPIEKQFENIWWNKKEISSYLKLALESNIKNLSSDLPTFKGGYINDYSDTKISTELTDLRIKTQFYKDNGDLYGFSNINIEYFNKIYLLCKENNIELYFIHTPLHPYYIKNTPKEYIEKFNELVSLYKNNYIDLSNFNLEDNCYLPDGDHVSLKGSIIISDYLNTLNKKMENLESN
jgi:hypothetical protein